MDRLVIDEAERVMRHQCGLLDPGSVPVPEAPGLYLALDRIAKLVEGAKTRLLARVDEAQPGAREGRRSTAEWDAVNTGTTSGRAREKLETSRRLGSQPKVDEALAGGRLSGEQANAVSDAAGADPSEEERLVREAAAKPVSELRRTCERVKANAHPDPEARRRAIHAGRFARTWTDREGGRNLHLRGSAEDLAPIEAHLARFEHAAFAAARTAGRHERHDAYAYDGWLAFLRDALAGGSAAPKGARRAETKVFVHVDLETLLRGRVGPGARCDIDGIGPVDLDWVRSILGESFVVALLEREGTIHDLVHLGRQATAAQRSYLEAMGWVCACPGCEVTHGLEIDHVDDWADTHRTTIDALAPLCAHHHDLKTHHGHRLTGQPGDRTWHAPDGTAIRRDRPPPGDPDPPPATDTEPATLFT